MVNEILLNRIVIKVEQFEHKKVDGLHELSVGFKVSSEEYHDRAMLLYQEVFDVEVPEMDIQFKGRIQQYSTSIINLYEKDQVGDYWLTLRETKE